MLKASWALDATYLTRDIDTGEIRTYGAWVMCFDGQGNGGQAMRADDGVTREGSVTTAFERKRVNLIEPGKLFCSNGGYIHQREIGCACR